MSATLMLERRLWEPVEFSDGTEKTWKIGKNFLIFQPSPSFVWALNHILFEKLIKLHLKIRRFCFPYYSKNVIKVKTQQREANEWNTITANKQKCTIKKNQYIFKKWTFAADLDPQPTLHAYVYTHTRVYINIYI